MEENKTNAGQGFGVAGLVLGIVSLCIAFIPCIGVLALLPGVIAIIFSFIAFNQAEKANGAKGLIIAALVIAIMSTVLAALWIFAFQQGRNWLKNHPDNVLEQTFDDNKESGSGQVDDSMEKKMETLESSDTTSFHFHLDKHMSKTEFDQFLVEYERLLQKTANEVKALQSEDSGSVLAYSREAVKLAKIMSRVAVSSQDLTVEQNKKIDAINRKYQDQLARFHKDKH